MVEIYRAIKERFLKRQAKKQEAIDIGAIHQELNNAPVLSFDFFCPEGRVEEAHEHLSQLEGVEISPRVEPGILDVFSQEGLATRQYGTQIKGLCPIEHRRTVVDILAENGIAGFSRDTKVHFYLPDADTRQEQRR